MGSGHQQVQGRAPPAAPSSNSRYSSSSSLGSSRNGEDVICSLNLRQMIEQGMKIFQHVSKSTLCSVFSGVKKTTNGDSIDVLSCFRNSSKVFLFPRWVRRSPKYFLVGFYIESGLAGWRVGWVMRGVKKGARRAMHNKTAQTSAELARLETNPLKY